MIARVEFPTMPPESVRLVWCEWFRYHTIDPRDVVVPGFVETDPDARQIRYLRYKRNDQGQPYTLDGEHVETEVRVYQLEARPSTFPVVS